MCSRGSELVNMKFSQVKFLLRWSRQFYNYQTVCSVSIQSPRNGPSVCCLIFVCLFVFLPGIRKSLGKKSDSSNLEIKSL